MIKMQNNTHQGAFLVKPFFFILVLLSITSFRVSAQTAFSFEDFKSLVLKNHPMVKQADLYPRDAETEIMQAKGQFDPKLSSTLDRKALGGSEYYNRWENALKVPVWTGTDLKLGYENRTGKKLLPEESPELLVAGITVPIGQGMIIDARRTTLKQAQLAKTISEAERLKLINKTVLSASKAYWEWWFSYQQLQFIQEGLSLANTRYVATKERAAIGEQAAIDSVEAKITLQDRQVALEQAYVELQNTRLALSNYLWDANENPLELPEGAIPPKIATRKLDEVTLQNLITQAKVQHPEIVKLDVKIKQLGLEEKLRKELLKPQLNFNFNFITKTLNSNYGPEGGISFDNHKMGVEFVMPIFLRKERGKLEQVRIKQLSTGFEYNLAKREVVNDIYAAYNDVKNLERQLSIQQQATSNQELLLKAEQRKFEIGESTLFLINSRESKFIDMKVKVESLRSKYEKALASLAYYSGLSEL